MDVEDYFQVSAFEQRVSRKNWDKYESRVEANTDRLLALLDQHQVAGTFFVLGWVADRYPQLVRRIQAGGHELASHGYWHELVYGQTPEEFAADIRLSRDAIGAASSFHVTAYRAPSFSITQRSLWALDILAEQGYLVDSSIFPISGHDRYGIADAQREIHELRTPHGTLTEFPPSAWHLRKFSLPIGGGYFRIFPYSLSRRAIGEARKRVGPAMFYTHPWEIDPVQPRIKGTGMKSRFRHYTGLRGTHARLDRMLQHWNFSSMENVLRAHAESGAMSSGPG